MKFDGNFIIAKREFYIAKRGKNRFNRNQKWKNRIKMKQKLLKNEIKISIIEKSCFYKKKFLKLVVSVNRNRQYFFLY